MSLLSRRSMYFGLPDSAFIWHVFQSLCGWLLLKLLFECKPLSFLFEVDIFNVVLLPTCCFAGRIQFIAIWSGSTMWEIALCLVSPQFFWVYVSGRTVFAQRILGSTIRTSSGVVPKTMQRVFVVTFCEYYEGSMDFIMSKTETYTILMLPKHFVILKRLKGTVNLIKLYGCWLRCWHLYIEY